MKKTFFIYFILVVIINANGSWMMNNRTHGELHWTTIETDNFNIHYHQGLRDIAFKGASIAEQIRPILLKQMGISILPKLDIVFTSEDEVLNGFAVPANYTIIWVDQNDAALWTGDEKWLRTVLAHELQHLVYFQTVKGPWWLPEPMNSLFTGVPGWVVEGLAEYFTEKWRPFRFEISHRGHVIRNTVQKIADPHNDGYSKSLYLADRFGDSTIVKILNYRNKLKYLDFKKSFKKHTGITLKQFNEDWRRQMNTFYYGQRAQKERLEEVGKVRKLPIKRVATFDYFSDTLRVAMIGKMSKGQQDFSLIIATRDTAKEQKIRKSRFKKYKKDGKKPKKVTPKWKKKELDHGRFGELNMNLDVSPDGLSIIYPKYRYGNNQSLGFDIWKVNIQTKKKILMTNSMRANYPKYSPDGESILFVSHNNSLSQLYIMDKNGQNPRPITSYKGDTQIITPAWSPDGNSIAFAMSESDGKMDLHILNISSGKTIKITDSEEADAYPIWHPGGEKISYTGFYEYSPNIFTYDIESKKNIRNTNLWNMLYGVDWNKQLSTVTSMTLNTVDSSRIIEVDVARNVKAEKIKINPMFSSWRTKSPDFPIAKIDLKREVKILNEEKYKFYKKMRHLGTIILPDNRGLLYNGAYTDALGKHTIGLGCYTDYDTLNGVFVQYQNATGFPFNSFWGFEIFNNANFQLQYYNREKAYIETYNGFSIWAKTPYNFGYSLSSNHIISSSLQFYSRELFYKQNVSSSVFPNPMEGKEGSFNLGYLLINKRGDMRNLFSPNQGYGFKGLLKIASSNLWGIFDYNKLELDFYSNLKLGPFSIFGRSRYEEITGSPPSQETPGIVNIPNFYFMGTLTPGREYMSPRGYYKNRLGDKAFMGTIELRAPVVPINFIELLRVIKFGMPTFAIISDYANAWSNSSDIDKMIITAGYEFRASINIERIPLITFSYGWAQEIEDWSNNIEPDPYFQLTLINPF